MWSFRIGLVAVVAGLLACSVPKEPVSLSRSDPSDSTAPEAATAPYTPMLMSEGEVLQPASATRGSGTSSHQHDADGSDAEETAGTYTCSMHPEVNQTAAGKCNICSMPLVPKPADDEKSHRKEPGG